MKYYRRRVRTALLVVFAFEFCLAAAVANEPDHPARLKLRPNDAATRSGFKHFYNADYESAVRDFEASLQAHPDDAFAINHVILALLFRELQRNKALDPNLYVSDQFLHHKPVKVDPATQKRLKALMQRALKISNRRLDTNSDDVDALYARGVTRSLKSAYLGLVEDSWFSALRNGLGAYKDHKQVLNLSPNYSEAKLVVGMYNYIVGSLPWHIKAAAFILAITGSKSEGIRYLSEAARGGGESSVDAKTFLSIFLSREHRYADAIALVRSLRSSYPHNFLFALGEANLLRKSGQLPEAATAYRQLMASARAGEFRDPPTELAAYGLAETLHRQGKLAEAAKIFDSIPAYPQVDPQLASEARDSAAEIRRVMASKKKSS